MIKKAYHRLLNRITFQRHRFLCAIGNHEDEVLACCPFLVVTCRCRWCGRTTKERYEDW